MFYFIVTTGFWYSLSMITVIGDKEQVLQQFLYWPNSPQIFHPKHDKGYSIFITLMHTLLWLVH